MSDNKNIKLGILGGGQLGMMSAHAAQKIGIKTVILTPEENSPTSTVAYKTIIAEYDNKKALKEFAAQVDHISYEFENIPVETIEYLKTLKPVYPDSTLLNISQDRIKEKLYLNSINIPTARWTEIKSTEDITKTLAKWNTEKAIIKTARFGYDGKGQARISKDTDLETTWIDFKNKSLIMEEIIDFECEISVIIARDIHGKNALYGPMLNTHKDHILDTTIVPAPIDQNVKNEALALTKTLADHINLIGILTLELFVTKDTKLLANEIAPRTHNSGHWSIEASNCSQFENHVRTVCGLAVADNTQHSPATMINLIGDDILDTEKYEENPNATLHNYGKKEIKQGRKMGHVTILNRQ